MAYQTPVNMLQHLATMPVFQGMTAAQLGDIVQYCQVRRLAKGEPVYCQGDKPRAFFHLIAGQVKRAVSSEDGGEKVLEILDPVQSFGEPELFGSGPYASFAEAVRPTVLLQIGREAVLRMIERDPGLSLRMLAAIADRQSRLERDAASRELQSGTARVMGYLEDLAGTAAGASGDTTLELAASKQLIAARLGLTPETLSRTLRSLADARLISVAGRRVTLHRSASPGARRMAGVERDWSAFAPCRSTTPVACAA